jgi:hypothetical protein
VLSAGSFGTQPVAVRATVGEILANVVSSGLVECAFVLPSSFPKPAGSTDRQNCHRCRLASDRPKQIARVSDRTEVRRAGKVSGWARAECVRPKAFHYRRPVRRKDSCYGQIMEVSNPPASERPFLLLYTHPTPTCMFYFRLLRLLCFLCNATGRSFLSPTICVFAWLERGDCLRVSLL